MTSSAGNRVDSEPSKMLPSKKIQLNYASEVVKLMLGHMYRIISRKGIPFATALTDHADIYRKTSLFNLTDLEETQRSRPRWDQCVRELETVFDKCLEQGTDAACLEKQAQAVLMPFLAERVDHGLPIVDYRQETSHGCFFYAPMDKVIDLHFTNKVMTESPFNRLGDRVQELLELLDNCSREYPRIDKIQFGSWLNDHPSYRRLFPASWKNTGETKSYNSFAWWGQFMARRGDIHAGNASRFRETGEFPYRCTFHACRIQDLKEHLTDFQSKGESHDR